MNDGRSLLLAYCLKYNNDWQLVYRAIQNHEEPSNEDWEEYDAFQVPFITILDAEYPALLKQKPPVYESGTPLISVTVQPASSAISAAAA